MLIKASIGDIAVESIERAETKARIRSAQILLHLPNDASSRHNKCAVNLVHELDALAPIGRHIPPQYRERVQPHRQIVEILAVPIRRFPDPDAARAPEYTFDIGHHPL